MTSYIIPFADTETNDVWIKKILATSLSDAKEKIQEYLQNKYDWDDSIVFPDDYGEFLDLMESNNILVGEIDDMDTI